MIPHRLRVQIIALANFVAFVAIVVLTELGRVESQGFAIAVAAQAVLFPALLDALAVERRRRDRTRPAIVDDERDAQP